MCKGSQQCQSKHKAASTACFHISMLASPRRRWNIALLHCTVGLCQCQPCSTYIPAIQTQGQLGNCLCEGHGTRKGTTMQTLRSYRAPQEALRPGEGYTRICTDNSSSSSWSWSSTTSASQWTPPHKRQEKVYETVTSWHMGQPEVMPCQHQIHLLEARA